MVTAKQLQNQYIKLYAQLRQYFWPMDIVKIIVDLEIAVYQTFPSIAEIQRLLTLLRSSVNRAVIIPSEELNIAFDEFEELLSASDAMYAKLYQVREEFTYEDFQE